MAAPSTSLDLVARSEARVRIPGDQGLDTRTESSSYDWELGATSNLLIDFRDTKIQVGYAPRFSLNDLTHQALSNLWQTGTLGVTWLWPRVQLSLTEMAAYGDRYFSALSNISNADPATGTLVLQALPRSTSVRDVSSDTAHLGQFPVGLSARRRRRYGIARHRSVLHGQSRAGVARLQAHAARYRQYTRARLVHAHFVADTTRDSRIRR